MVGFLVDGHKLLGALFAFERYNVSQIFWTLVSHFLVYSNYCTAPKLWFTFNRVVHHTKILELLWDVYILALLLAPSYNLHSAPGFTEGTATHYITLSNFTHTSCIQVINDLHVL